MGVGEKGGEESISPPGVQALFLIGKVSLAEEMGHMIRQSHYWVYPHSNEKRVLVRMRVHHTCSQQHHSQQPKRGNNPKVHQR